MLVLTGQHPTLDPTEFGLPSVPVELLNSTNTVIGTTFSGPDGSYLFPNLLPGQYTVRYQNNVPPPGYAG